MLALFAVVPIVVQRSAIALFICTFFQGKSIGQF